MELSGEIWNNHQSLDGLCFFKEGFRDNHIIKDTEFPVLVAGLSNISNDNHPAVLSRIKLDEQNEWLNLRGLEQNPTCSNQ